MIEVGTHVGLSLGHASGPADRLLDTSMWWVSQWMSIHSRARARRRPKTHYRERELEPWEKWRTFLV